MDYLMFLLVIVSVLQSASQQEITFFDYKHCKLTGKATPREVVLPWQKWPTVDVTLCDRELPYKDAIIEEALAADKDLFQLYKTLTRDMFPLPYQEIQSYTTPENFACKDTCPGIYKNATAVIVNLPVTLNGYTSTKTYECNIIRPWEQIVPYMQCKKDTPSHIALTGDATFYCVPNSFVEREVVIFCEDAKPQCKHVRLKVPMGCSMGNIKCRGEEIVQRQQQLGGIGDTSQTDALFADFLSLLGR